MITSNVETISPSLAKAYLEKSKGNRRISNAYVKRYANDISNGNWILNGAAIKFDENGTLIDGHHRLRAIIEAEMSIKTVVTRGVVANGSIETVDSGRNRTLGQLIDWTGARYSTALSATIYAYFQYKRCGYCGITAGISNGNTKTRLDFYKENKEILDKCAKSAQTFNGASKSLKVSILGGSMFYLVNDCGYDFDFVNDFFSKVCSYKTSDNKTIEQLRVRLLSIREAVRVKSVQDDIICAYIIKAWNNYVKGSFVKVLKYDPNVEQFPTFIKIQNTLEYK